MLKKEEENWGKWYLAGSTCSICLYNNLCADLQLQRQLCKYRAVMAEGAKRQAVEKSLIKPDVFWMPQGKAELSFATDILLWC